MSMLFVPRGIAEALFGSLNNFYIAITILAIAGLFVALKLNRRSNKEDKNYWLNEAQRKQNSRFEYMNSPIIEASEARKAKEEADLNEAKRLERYKKYREGQPPTYEEWKAAKLKEQAEEQGNR